MTGRFPLRRIVLAVLTAAFAPSALLGTLAAAGASMVNDFDVNGVKLYMTPDEALAALRAKNVDVGALKIARKPCTKVHQAALAAGKVPDASNDCVLELQHVEPGLQVTYDFIEDYPANPGVTRLFAMEYYQYNFRTPADRDAFRARVVAKYGKPDVVADRLNPDGGNSAWCSSGVALNCFSRRNPEIQYPPNPKVLVSNGYPNSFDSSPLPSFYAVDGLAYPVMTLNLSNAGATLSVTDLHYGALRAAASKRTLDQTSTGVKTKF